MRNLRSVPTPAPKTKQRYEIESGVDMPAPRSRVTEYPFLDMKRGNSFFVACEGDEALREHQSHRHATDRRACVAEGWKRYMSEHRTTDPSLNYSASREDDGDISLELYVNNSNLINMSVGADGRISWAGMVGGKSECGRVTDPMALLLFKLLDAFVEPL